MKSESYISSVGSSLFDKGSSLLVLVFWRYGRILSNFFSITHSRGDCPSSFFKLGSAPFLISNLIIVGLKFYN